MSEPATLTIQGRDPATGDGIEVVVAGGRVAELRACETDRTSFVSAGLVDLQVNGYGGIDLNSGALDPDDVAALTALLWARGVTTYLPTLITASEAALVQALRAIAEARRRDARIAHTIPGIHVEGPFISPADGARGAHPEAHVRPCDLAEFARWQEASGGLVALVTLSPYDDDALPFIEALVARGIHVALGHTDASPERIHAAAKAGARLSTHLGNGVPAMLPRHPNVLWAQLADDRLTASFIADGHHLPADTFRAMLRAKGVGNAVLVSDSAAPGGLPPGLYDQPIGGRVELRSDGWLGTPGTPYLAGAARSLCEDVAIAARMADLSLADALTLATVNPGRFVGDRGRLAPAAAADLIVFDWSPGAHGLAIRETYVEGVRA